MGGQWVTDSTGLICELVHHTDIYEIGADDVRQYRMRIAVESVGGPLLTRKPRCV
jgi:hypothetical protein